MDGFFLAAITRELADRIAGARIEKIWQPAAETFILRLWTGRERVRLLLALAAGEARVHLTDARWPNPPAPPRFCQLLRARLARIEAVEKVAHERCLHFLCRGSAGEPYQLVAEFFASQANLLLVDGEGKVVDALRRQAGGREIVSGAVYRPLPTPERLLLADASDVPDGIAAPAAFERWLLDRLTPMSVPLAADLRAAVVTGITPSAALAGLRQRWLTADFRPAVASWQGQPLLTALPLPHLALTAVEEFASPSAAADRFYRTAAPTAAGDELRGAVSRALRRLRSRLTKIEADRRDEGEAAGRRQAGELLLANLHRMRRGMAEITVDNYYADPPAPLRIPLDPRLSPQENAERCFRDYKKRMRGREHAERRFRETTAELAWLEETAHFLDEAQGPEELAAIRRDLVEAGLLPKSVTPRTRQKTPSMADSVRRGRTPGGFQLCWGRNSRSNEYVSRELTGADDLWFHALNLPGCHLVLKRAGRPRVPEEDQLFAAAVAAGYSRGKGEGKVEVLVAEGRHVRQPKGARPGQVTVERYRTVLVAPQRLEEPPVADPR